MKIDHAVMETLPLAVSGTVRFNAGAPDSGGARARTAPVIAPADACDWPLLDRIESPQDLRKLPADCLEALCGQIRGFLLASVAQSGGHFASSLGVVELTVALHRVFDTAHDRLIWDVGHQAYVHKMLTGRRGQLHSIRKAGGLAGFPSRAESAHDAFGTAHSSTSISAVLGMAVAARREGISRHHVAVIGDGALTAGLAYEALCNASQAGIDAIVVINDNQMSISENVGAIPAHLDALMQQRGRSPDPSGSAAATGLRSDSLFEALGLQYSGPVDGHDVGALVDALDRLSRRQGVQVLHIRTCKGKGYDHAERDPIAYHGPGPFDAAVGLTRLAAVQPAVPSALATMKPVAGGSRLPRPTFSQVFGSWACEAAAHDPRVIVVTPAMREGSGLVEFARRFPEQYFDVGIAEQHALTFAAGMACDAVRPVVAIYSTFLQRAYDQLVHDIALQNLPVMLAIDRAGLVGADGPTHAGSFDIAFLRPIPNLTVMTPADEAECARMLTTGLGIDGPSAVRYPRGTGAGVLPDAAHPPVAVGRAQLRRRGKRVAILAFGTLLYPALEAADALDATVVNMRFVKPLDTAMIAAVARTHELLVTIEEGALMGGAGSAVQEALGDLIDADEIPATCASSVLRLGLPDRFVAHGDCATLLAECGLDVSGITAAIRRRLAACTPSPSPSLRAAVAR